jgi:hypothetical protein
MKQVMIDNLAQTFNFVRHSLKNASLVSLLKDIVLRTNKVKTHISFIAQIYHFI